MWARRNRCELHDESLLGRMRWFQSSAIWAAGKGLCLWPPRGGAERTSALLLVPQYVLIIVYSVHSCDPSWR